MRLGIAAFARAPLWRESVGLGRGLDDGSLPECFQAGGKLVRFIVDERVEGVPEPGLSDKLERGAAHPFVDVELCGARGTDALVDGTNELREKA